MEEGHPLASAIMFTGRSLHILLAAIGAMIGVGWITVLGSWLEVAGPVGAAMAFALGAIAILPIALCYAELTGRHNASGGEIGHQAEYLSNTAAFTTAWFLLLAFLATAAFEAASFGWLFISIFPEFRGGVVHSIGGVPTHSGEITSGIIVTCLFFIGNLAGHQSSRFIQLLTTIGKLAAAAVFITAGLAFGSIQNLSADAAQTTFGIREGGVLSVLVTTPFWYAGFNAAVQLTYGASKNELRSIGFAFVAAILVAGMFYCLLIFSAGMAAPAAFQKSDMLPAAAIFSNVADWLGPVVILAGILGILSTFNAVLVAGASVISRFTDRTVVPLAIGAIVAGLGAICGRAIIIPVINVAAFCLSVVFLLTCLAAFGARMTLGRPPDGSFILPGGRGTIGIAIVLSAAFVFLALLELLRPSAPLSNEILVLAAWGALGLTALQLFPSMRERLSR